MYKEEYLSRLAPSMAAESHIIAVSMYACVNVRLSGCRHHKTQSIYHLPQGLREGGSLNGCDSPRGCRCCSLAWWLKLLCRSYSLSSSPAHPPSPPVHHLLPSSGSLRPASPQLAAATVAACLLHLLYIFPVFCLSSPLFSSLLSSGLWNFQ